LRFMHGDEDIKGDIDRFSQKVKLVSKKRKLNPLDD
jgi:hypothetical protein